MNRALLMALILAGCSDGTLKVDDKPPEVTILRPVDGAEFDPAVPLSLCVQVDDDRTQLAAMQVTVASSLDGLVWELEGEPTACEGGNLSVELELSESDHALTVTAVDELGGAGEDITNIKPSLNTAPTCAIVEPRDGAAVLLGESLRLVANADDPESDPAQLVVTLD
ncbi:MAG TPA: hypothetical protein PLA94_29215, partial [Myxococcota bacterium]|nr:hypothetical protein [Myxococcota bacterium]